MKVKLIYIAVLLFGFAPKMLSQELLTLEDAVKIALENNYDIKLSKNDLRIDEANATVGNAGMLPKVTANVVDNNNVQYSTQTRQDGTRTELNNAKNNNLTYGVNLDWTVFDGFKMFAKKSQLDELKKLGDSRLKLTIVTKISDVTVTYHDLVQQQQQLAALDSSIVISNQRFNLAQNRYSIGKSSKLEVLNAQVDLNTDQTALLKQKESLKNTKILLNLLLARDAKIEFNVVNLIEVDKTLLLPELTDLAIKQNPELEAQIINRKIAELQLKQVQGNRYPTVRVNTGYNFAESQSSLGFTSESYSRGLNYGFSATLNIFDGFAQHRNEKIAKIELENSKIAIEQQTATLKSELESSYQTYLTNLELMQLEERNEAIAKQNMDITLEKFRIGTITPIEFRTAQLNYINAKARNTNMQFQAKLSEINLKELAGNLTF
ncbi:MAG: TolC family protein [Bacteroidota bacterium]